MYEFFKQAIEAESYADLNSFLAKLRMAWGRGLLTNGQLDELTASVQSKEPKKLYDLQQEIDKLWEAIRELQRQSMPAQPQEDGEGDHAQENVAFVQPTGAHDAYSRGDRVAYKGKIYLSLVNGNVWAPDVYPAAWQEQSGV